MGMDYIAFSTTPAAVRSPMGQKPTPTLPFHPRAFVYFNFFIEGSFNSIYSQPDVYLNETTIEIFLKFLFIGLLTFWWYNWYKKIKVYFDSPYGHEKCVR